MFGIEGLLRSADGELCYASECLRGLQSGRSSGWILIVSEIYRPSGPGPGTGWRQGRPCPNTCSTAGAWVIREEPVATPDPLQPSSDHRGIETCIAFKFKTGRCVKVFKWREETQRERKTEMRGFMAVVSSLWTIRSFLNESLIWLGNNESSQTVIHSLFCSVQETEMTPTVTSCICVLKLQLFYFIQLIHLWISVMVVIFLNVECGNKELLML